MLYAIDDGVFILYNVFISSCDKTLLYILISAKFPPKPRAAPSPLCPIVKVLECSNVCPDVPVPDALQTPFTYKFAITAVSFDKVYTQKYHVFNDNPVAVGCIVH